MRIKNKLTFSEIVSLAHPLFVLPPRGVDVALELGGDDEPDGHGGVALARGAGFGAIVVVGDDLTVAGDHEVAVGLDELEELREVFPLGVADLHVLVDVGGGDVLLVPGVQEVAGGGGHCGLSYMGELKGSVESRRLGGKSSGGYFIIYSKK